MPTADFWREQRVFITGHTGFKGAWAARWLSRLGANQFGFSLAPNTEPALFPHLDLPGLTSTLGDIRDPTTVAQAIGSASPTIAIHMAAQPLVRASYEHPIDTFGTNVMGTVNVLEGLRHYAPQLRAVLVVTTDKVYANDNSGRAFKEDGRLGGHDPYSSSKAACEEVVSSYRQSYFDDLGVAVATARAGNVIGGGDWSQDRLVPDIWRALSSGQGVTLRNPESVRPWQHVLDPLSGYLDYIEAMLSTRWTILPRALNFAPLADEPMTVRDLTESLSSAMGMRDSWNLAQGRQPVEMKLLTLDASLANQALGWRPQLTGRQAVEWTADWIKMTRESVSMQDAVDNQIDIYEGLLEAQRGVAR